MEKRFIEWNEQMFVKYNNVRLYSHPNPIIRYTESKRVEIILAAVSSSAAVVDVGCGEGYVLSRIRAPTLVGVDLSKTALAEASKAAKATLVRADAESLPFNDSYFDAAICSETLEHTQHPEKVVSELQRIVCPDGLIVLSVPNEPLINKIKDAVWSLGLFGILFPDVPRRQNDEWHLHSFDQKKLREIARGLDIQRIQAVPSFFLPIRYVAICQNVKSGPAKSGKMFSKASKDAGGYLDCL